MCFWHCGSTKTFWEYIMFNKLQFTLCLHAYIGDNIIKQGQERCPLMLWFMFPSEYSRYGLILLWHSRTLHTWNDVSRWAFCWHQCGHILGIWRQCILWHIRLCCHCNLPTGLFCCNVPKTIFKSKTKNYILYIAVYIYILYIYMVILQETYLLS